MSLRRKILFKDGLLLVSLMLMTASCLWGFFQQRRHVQASLDELAAIAQVEQAQSHLNLFIQSLSTGHMSEPDAIQQLHDASLRMRQYKATVTQYKTVLPPEISEQLQAKVKSQTQEIVTRLVQLNLQMNSSSLPDPVLLRNSTERISGQISQLLTMCDGFVQRTELESSKDLFTACCAVAIIAGCTLLIAVLASVWQYRWIMQPLQSLRIWCQNAAQGDFKLAYQPTNDREFQELGRDVNKMASELADFHQRLEAMVASKSRELVRSERLASVGYLAAGVAHEINNPLNIMSGYAELTIKRLQRLGKNETDAEVIEHLSIIRSEAFRCKEITQKLLSLAKGNGDQREPVSITDAVNEVVTMVRGVKSFRSRQLDVNIDANDPLAVIANTTEIKQVLLNLIVNAVEAVGESTGRVVITARRVDDWVQLDVIDNGRGMTPQTRERVFEPFFTNKRGAGEPGTGLGLSITHAIVTHHGGEISAFSEGLNFGSRFTVRLPAASQSGFTQITPAAHPATVS